MPAVTVKVKVKVKSSGLLCSNLHLNSGLAFLGRLECAPKGKGAAPYPRFTAAKFPRAHTHTLSPPPHTSFTITLVIRVGFVEGSLYGSLLRRVLDEGGLCSCSFFFSLLLTLVPHLASYQTRRHVGYSFPSVLTMRGVWIYSVLRDLAHLRLGGVMLLFG